MAKRTIDIEELLNWAYQRQKVEGANRGPILGFADDSVLRVARRAMTGSGGSGGPSIVHDDALLVADAVERLAPIPRGLVMAHARAGTRPDDTLGMRTRIVPRRRKPDGRAETEVLYDRNRHRIGEWTPIATVDDAESIEWHRNIWRLWWCALEDLRHQLARPGLLEDHAPTGPAVSAAPWALTAAAKCS